MDDLEYLKTHVSYLLAENARLLSSLKALETRVTTLEYRLTNSSATLVCADPGPGGTITLTFPAPP